MRLQTCMNRLSIALQTAWIICYELMSALMSRHRHTLVGCRLYVNVITTIKGYGNYLWVDVVAQIDTMSEEVAAFQNQCKRLPKVKMLAPC